jgi:hypothetical protein
MTAYTVAPILEQIYGVLSPFIQTATGLPAASVVQGLQNRNAMPLPGFVAMTATLKNRLRTNVDSWDTTIDDPTQTTQEQGIQLTVQLDCYGPASSEWSDILATLLRDEVGCAALEPICDPLYCNDPIQAPLTNAEQQYEQRWIVGAVLQYNPVVAVPMQFADALAADVINVDEAYPP